MCIFYDRSGKTFHLNTFEHGQEILYLGRDLRAVCEKHTVLGHDPAVLERAIDLALDSYLLESPIIIDSRLYYLSRAGLGSTAEFLAVPQLALLSEQAFWEEYEREYFYYDE